MLSTHEIQIFMLEATMNRRIKRLAIEKLHFASAAARFSYFNSKSFH